MSQLDYSKFNLGNIEFPLSGYASNSAIAIADVPVNKLLGFCRGVLEIHAGDAWTYYANQLNLDCNQIVEESLPYNPIPWLQDTTYNFPLLALYRTKGSIVEKTIAYHRIESNLELLWIMPPLTAAQAYQLLPFQNAVIDILVDRNEQGWDPNYLDGYNIGELAGFDSLQVMSYSLANVSVNPNQFLPTVQLSIRLRERKTDASGMYPEFTGVDLTGVGVSG